MKHGLTTIAAFAILSFCSCATSELSLTKAIEKSAEKIAGELPAESRVAIAAFESPNGSLSDYIMEELADALFNRKIEVANKQNLAFARRYLNLQPSGDISDEAAQLIGALLGVEFVITGQLRNIGDSYRLTVNTINVEATARESVIRFNVRNDQKTQKMIAALDSQPKTARSAGYGMDGQNAPQTAQAFIERGIQLAVRGEYLPTIADFTEAIRLNPQSVESYVLRGRALYAAVSKVASVEADFANFVTYTSGGRVSAGRKRVYDQAIADFSEAIRINPNNAAIYSERGRVYGLKEDYDRAITDQTKAIKIDTNYALAYLRRGAAYGSKGDYDRAITDYTQAIKMDPNDASAYSGRGAAYGSKGDYDREIADLNQSIKIDPNNAVAYKNRSAVYSMKGDYDRVISDLTQAIKIDPNDAIAYSTRGAAYVMKGDYDRVIADVTQAIKIDPKEADAFAYTIRGAAHHGKGDYDRAIADLNQAIKIDPNYALAYSQRSAMYLSKSDYDQAIADLTQTIRIDPNNALIYSERGKAYLGKGDYDRAIADLSQAIKIDTNNESAYTSRGRAYLGNGDYDRAIGDLNQAIKINPNNAGAYTSRGGAYLGKGNYDRAIGDLNQAINIDPNNASAYANRSRAYRMKGDYDRAIADQTHAEKIGLAADTITIQVQSVQVGNAAGGSSLAIDRLDQATVTLLKKEPWREGLLRAMGVNPRYGAMPPLSSAEQRCKAMIDRQKRNCAYSESGSCSPSAVQRDVAACVENLRREWLARR